MQLKWSLALTQKSIVFASNTIPNATNESYAPWACVIVASTLKVLTASGILGIVDLSHSCPAVTAAVVLDCTTSFETNNATSDYTNENNSFTIATVLLSCAGDRYFTLTLHLTATGCTAINICERFFLLPAEATKTQVINSNGRQTRTMLPSCDSLKRVPTKWLQPSSNSSNVNNENDVLILLGFHASFGIQLIMEGKNYAIVANMVF